MITFDEAHKLFSYNAETGILTNKVDRGLNGNSVRAGTEVGTLEDNGYRALLVNRGRYKSHRLIWLMVYGSFPEDEIDHINHIRDDNRLCNLRDASHDENMKNLSLAKDNTSGFTGVYFMKRQSSRQAGFWGASIKHEGKRIYLGLYKSKLIAIIARAIAEKKYAYHKNHGRI